jgi:hypothetical protein
MRPSVLLVAALGCNAPSDDANQIDANLSVDALTDAETVVCPISGIGTVNGSVLGAEVAPVLVARVTETEIGPVGGRSRKPTIVFGETSPQDPAPCASGLPSAPDYLKIIVCEKAIGTYALLGVLMAA